MAIRPPGRAVRATPDTRDGARRALAKAHHEPKLPRGKDFNGDSFPSLHYGWVAEHRAQRVAPRPTRVVQGKLGDCFFLAAFVAVAKTHPGLLESLYQDHGDGTYTVTFLGGGPKGTPIDVTVAGTFPKNADGDLVFARGHVAAVFEKAYAKLRGGYHVIDQGGFGSRALKTLTGKSAYNTTMKSVGVERLWRMVSKAVEENRPIITSTPVAKDLKRVTGDPLMEGLIDAHQYVVLDRYERAGQRYVKVYSTLSPADAKGPADAKRLREMTFEYWHSRFADFAIGGR